MSIRGSSSCVIHLTHGRAAMWRYPSCKPWDTSSVSQMCSVSETEPGIFPSSPDLWLNKRPRAVLKPGHQGMFRSRVCERLERLKTWPQPLAHFCHPRARFAFCANCCCITQGAWGPRSLCTFWSLWSWRWQLVWIHWATEWHNLETGESEAENLLWKMVGRQTLGISQDVKPYHLNPLFHQLHLGNTTPKQKVISEQRL